jgi:integrase
MSLEKISVFLGHSSLESTQIYTHLAESHWVKRSEIEVRLLTNNSTSCKH